MKILTTGWPQGPELGPRADQLALLKLGWEPREGDATWVCVHTLGWSPAYVYRYAGLEAYARRPAPARALGRGLHAPAHTVGRIFFARFLKLASCLLNLLIASC